MVGSGSNIYGGVDWVAMGMSAPDTVDLCDPKVKVPHAVLLSSLQYDASLLRGMLLDTFAQAND